MPVRFGDCASPDVTWVSGPRPQPFTDEQAKGVWIAAAAEPATVTPDRGKVGTDDPQDRPYPMTHDEGERATAHNAGMKSIAVTWGFHDRERLLAAGPDQLVNAPGDLLQDD